MKEFDPLDNVIHRIILFVAVFVFTALFTIYNVKLFENVKEALFQPEGVTEKPSYSCNCAQGMEIEKEG